MLVILFCRRGVYSVFIKLHWDVLQPVSTLSVLRLVLPYSAVSALDDTTPGHCPVLQNSPCVIANVNVRVKSEVI